MNFFIYVLAVCAGEIVLINEGDHFTKVIENPNYTIENDCDAKSVEIEFTNIEKMTQTIKNSDIVQIVLFPSNPNIILVLEQQGVLSVMFQELSDHLSEFKQHGTLNLNSQGLSDLKCSDMTQATALIFIAVCTSNNQIYIAKIICNQEVQCTSTLYLQPSLNLQCQNPSIITETTWRSKDPSYFTIYCVTDQESELQQISQIYMFKHGNLLGNEEYIVAQLQIPKMSVQKISFFDEQTLMVLDYYQGLFVVKFKYETPIITYTVLLQQLFLTNERFIAMSYSHEQSAIRFPPVGIVQNDIQFSLVIVSNLYLYELVLPETSSQFNSVRLPMSDKILLKSRSELLDNKGQKLQQVSLNYDQMFYYLCIYTKEQETECIRIERHSQNQHLTRGMILNDLSAPLLMVYPVAYSTTAGESVVLMSQQNKELSRITLIGNTIERFTIKSLTSIPDLCTIDIKQNGYLMDYIFVITGPSTQPVLFVIQPSLDIDIPTTHKIIKAKDLVRGPAPVFVTHVDKQNVVVRPLTGVSFPMDTDIYNEYYELSRYRKTFSDDGFRVTFLQLDRVIVVVQYSLPGTNNFTIGIDEAECTYPGQIKEIVGVSPYYLVFYQFLNEYSIISITGDDFNIECTNQQLILDTSDYDVYIDINFLNVFLHVDNAIYYSEIGSQEYYKINVPYRFRQLNFQFLKHNIILGSYENQLYLIELLNPYKSLQIESEIQVIELQQLSDIFTFEVLQIDRVFPYLIIIDETIKLYIVQNLQFDVLYHSELPSYNHPIVRATVGVNYNTLIVPIRDAPYYFIYDLTLSGSDRLVSVQHWDNLPDTVVISSPKQQAYNYCVEFRNATINCYHDLLIDLQLLNSDPLNIDNIFNINIQAYSTFDDSDKSQIILTGKFKYQDTLISIAQQNTHQQIDIYKTQHKATIDISTYFNGPIFTYSLEGKHIDYFELNKYIRQQKDNSVIIKSNQIVSGTTVNKDYLIILGNTHISIIKIAQTQYSHQQQETIIKYDDINVILKKYKQPTITNCFNAFINPLQSSSLSRVSVLGLICGTELGGIHNDNELDYMSFTILSDNQPIDKQFLNNMFFLDIDYQSYIYQAQSTIHLTYFQMINYPIKLNPYTFITISGSVKQNKRYSGNYIGGQQDDVIQIFVGFHNQTDSSFISGYQVDEIGSHTFGLDSLIVNNFQMACIEGCKAHDSDNVAHIDTIIEIVFNDQLKFNIYRIQMYISYTNHNQPIYAIRSLEIINLETELRKELDKEFQFSYMDTQVNRFDDYYSINVTTNSIGFDIVFDNQFKFTVEQIFKQYTDCPSPTGSMLSSYNEYFALSCRNDSIYLDQQTQYIKLFIRKQEGNKDVSVIEALQLEGEIQLLEIEKNVNSNVVQLLILEKLSDKFRLSWYDLQNQFILKMDKDSPLEEFEINLCVQNLHNHKNDKQCTELHISNVGYGEYIFKEVLLFMMFLIIPLILSVGCVIYGITKYKKEKQSRIEDFGFHLEEQLKGNSNYTVQSLRKASSALETIY